VEEICASEGSSLAVDQIIIKFAKWASWIDHLRS
jgi:hypothetical protein